MLRGFLKYDPTEVLLNSKNEALIFITKRDLLKVQGMDKQILWDLPEPKKIIAKQQNDGRWKYPGNQADGRLQDGYDQLETFRQLGYLIEKYGFDKSHKATQKAADFLFSCQTKEGDFRGIYGSQYATTYSPMIGEILIKAGYAKDKRVINSLDWLMSMRQNDGGWAIPLRTKSLGYYEALNLKEPLQADKTKPFSHLITGCALRALSIHPKYKDLPEVKHAGELLLGRFFERDKYADRSAVSFWTGFSYPYWFTDLLSSLDSLSYLGISKNEPKIIKALDWFKDHQSGDGSFKDLHLLRGGDKQQYLWVTLQICRVIKRFEN